jgi:hypothetical protein
MGKKVKALSKSQRLEDLKERIEFQKKCYLFWIAKAEEIEKEFAALDEDDYQIDLEKEEKLKVALNRLSEHL